MRFLDYRCFTEKELRGRKVRTTTVLKNGMFTIPTGTVCTIEGKQAGFNLIGEPCLTCGVRVSISRVPPTAVELL